MKPLPSERFGDVIAAHALLAAAAAELLMRELYHAVSVEVPKLLALALVWSVVASLLAASARSSREPMQRRLGRTAVLGALLALLHVVLGSPAVAAVGAGGAARWFVVAAAALLALLLRVVLVAQPKAWPRLRRAMAVFGVALVASQPVIAAWRAPALRWPGAETAVATGVQAPKVAMLLFLLDELNANQAAPIVDSLVRLGLQVQFKAIRPVGGNTVEVVPAMFTGSPFEQAKPCGPTAVCGDRAVLDFAKVTASRPDIDVVGFFHPYCAMRGLRWCRRLSVRSGVTDADRWLCAVLHRTAYPTEMLLARCADVYSRYWIAMTDSVLDAVDHAPVWQRGGMLFAHLPLPHPPGRSAAGSLEQHYHVNVERVAESVGRWIAQAQLSGLELRIVIFSDHVLRQRLWCDTHLPYAAAQCRPAAALEDRSVPLIVAGRQLPNLDPIDDNSQVFRLIKNWP